MQWSLLSGLAPVERDRLLAATRRRSYAKGEVLFHAGDPADTMHLVESGRLAVRVDTADGRAATLNLLGPGDSLGELALLGRGGSHRSATVVALEPVVTRSLSASVFAQLRQQHRSADEVLLTLLAARVEELSDRLVEVMFEGLDSRVHRRLDELAGTYAEGPGPVVVPITQEGLAELVGGTRPSVNQVLQKLVARGVVELGRGQIVVIDRQWLARGR